jgi:hypothetical protein
MWTGRRVIALSFRCADVERCSLLDSAIAADGSLVAIPRSNSAAIRRPGRAPCPETSPAVDLRSQPNLKLGPVLL